MTFKASLNPHVIKHGPRFLGDLQLAAPLVLSSCLSLPTPLFRIKIPTPFILVGKSKGEPELWVDEGEVGRL